jgi:hypothetical protein
MAEFSSKSDSHTGSKGHRYSLPAIATRLTVIHLSLYSVGLAGLALAVGGINAAMSNCSNQKSLRDKQATAFCTACTRS